MTQENHPTISRYTVGGTYHAATISRQTRTKLPMILAKFKFSASSNAATTTGRTVLQKKNAMNYLLIAFLTIRIGLVSEQIK